MDAGLKLKNVREKLGLRYREVEQASNRIAQRLRSSDYAVGLSRLADIENKGVVPNIHRLYSLCAIYRLDFEEVLGWYGVPMDEIWRDALSVKPARTHPLDLLEPKRGAVTLPLMLDPGIDFNETTFLSRAIQEWGRVPLSLLDNLDMDSYRYGFIGWEDRRMYPLLPPGSLVQIDDSLHKVAQGGWRNDFERPIYFVETREWYACSWCSVSGDHLILQPHSASGEQPEILKFPGEVDVIGQVVGVAMHLEPIESARPRAKKRARSAVSPE